MLIDSAEIMLEAGHGGSGAVSFRREKYKPKGGPDGGDGGNGGHVIIEAVEGIFTLLDFRPKKHLKAPDGRRGGGNNKSGKAGKDLTLKLPTGTQIYDAVTGELIADLTRDKEKILIARGGKGGKGNARFATSTRQAPRFAQKGIPGEKIKVKLELKFIADIGLIGMPNAGKSTLLSKISSANPKIADYPFTTLAPNLGVVKTKDYRVFVAADIPGLIENAHRGSGLGDKFLKHIERTKVLVHVVDITHKDPLKNITIINRELNLYNLALTAKPQIIALNKIDLLDTEESQPIKSQIEKQGYLVYTISAATRTGLNELIEGILKCLPEKV